MIVMPPRAHVRSTLLLAMGLLLAAASPTPALSYVSVEAGELLLVNPDLNEGDVSQLLPTIGATVPLVEIGAFRFQIGAHFWGTQYEQIAATGRFIPTQIETANQVVTIGAWVAPLAGVRFLVAGGKIELGVAAGLSLGFQFPVWQSDVQQGGTAGLIKPAYAYFFAGRFLYPESRLWIRWIAFDELALRLSITALYPLFHAWDGGQFLDGFVVSALVGFDIRIPQRKAAAAAAAPAATPGAGSGTP
jgi:hypothetical protein